jgi:hypothetical protein
LCLQQKLNWLIRFSDFLIGERKKRQPTRIIFLDQSYFGVVFFEQERERDLVFGYQGQAFKICSEILFLKCPTRVLKICIHSPVLFNQVDWLEMDEIPGNLFGGSIPGVYPFIDGYKGIFGVKESYFYLATSAIRDFFV